MLFIGIDTGVNTGYAVWDSGTQSFQCIDTITITQAFKRIEALIREGNSCTVIFEDARLRHWFGTSGPEKWQGAGSIKRDATIWETWCKENDIPYLKVAPKNNRTKLSSALFRKYTNYNGRTTDHARDAAMLVFGRRDNIPELYINLKKA